MQYFEKSMTRLFFFFFFFERHSTRVAFCDYKRFFLLRENIPFDVTTGAKKVNDFFSFLLLPRVQYNNSFFYYLNFSFFFFLTSQLLSNMDYAMEATSVPIEHKFEPYDDNGG